MWQKANRTEETFFQKYEEWPWDKLW
jgi:hypothetical protein